MRFQHGDVILVLTKKVPTDVKKIKVSAGFVVEKGEGVHTHVIQKPEGLNAYVDSNGVMWLTVDKPVVIDHEEHGPKTLMPGIYRKDIENEYDAETDETFKTQD